MPRCAGGAPQSSIVPMPPSSRFAYIDSARAIAAGLVVWQHSTEMFVRLAPEAANRWMLDVANAADFGRMGVIVFFAISGFVIPASLDGDGPGTGRTFLIRRFFRLFPAYWLSIPLGILACWLPFGSVMPGRDLALNFTMLPEILGAKPVLGLYWTLAYELGFYALCLVLWRLGLLSRAWTMLILLLASTALGGVLILGAVYLQRAELGGAALTVLCFGAMFAGTCWRAWLDGAMADRLQRLAGGLALLGWLVVLPLGCAAVYLVSGQQNTFFVRLPASYAGGLLIFLLLTTVVRINWRPLAWVGLVSYSLYLFHPVVLYPLFKLFEGLGLRHVNLAPLTLLTFVLAIAFSAAVFYAVERPAIGLGRRLTHRPRAAVLTPAEEVV